MRLATNYIEACNGLKREPKKWLITGVCGFIGSNLLEELLLLGQYVIGVDNLSTGRIENLEEVEGIVGQELWSNFHFIKGDITNLNVCMETCCEVDYVLHQAALGSVSRSVKDPIASNLANVNGFLNIIFSAKEHGVKKFVYASSSSVYGDHQNLPKVEHVIGNPLSPYAVTKLCNEMYAGVFGKTYNLSTTGLRYFNVFGKRQNINGEYAAVIPRWIASAIRGETVIINGDGETSRDFCYIKNVIQANILSAVSQDDSNSGGIYNIAVGDRTSLNELYLLIARTISEQGINKKANLIDYQDFRGGDVRHSLANIEKAKLNLGYSPTYDLKDGLAETVAWYRQRLI